MGFIDTAIAEMTHASGTSEPGVWIYGEMLWAKETAFEFTVEHGRRHKTITILTDMVKRYRDGGSTFFLIEMPAAMAKVNGLEKYLLTPDELEWKKRNIRTDRVW